MINIENKRDCCGCFACYNACPQNCIEITMDEEGFYYPLVDLSKCNNCDICFKSCHINNKTETKNNQSAYACVNSDDETRKNSSSGGIFYLLAREVLKNGGVVFGAGYDDEFNVIHKFIERIEDIKELQGSKYVQSRIGDTYKKVKEFLTDKKEVLYSGTPCQIAGLKSFLKKDYGNLLCVDFICHGVPSPLVWKKYVEFRENRTKSKAKSINFRDKKEGWKFFSMNFNFENGCEYTEILTNDIYLKGFLNNTYLRPSCYNCNFKGLNRLSDITLADFWGIKNILPEMDDDKGISLVFVNSEKGKKIFNEISEFMICKTVDKNSAIKYNSGAIESAKLPKNRSKFFSDLKKHSFERAMNNAINISFATKCKIFIYKIIKKIK